MLGHESAAFFSLLFEGARLRGDRYRDRTLLRRQTACLRALRVGDPVQGMRAMREHSSLAPRALAAALVGVTSFFRDPAVFAALRRELAGLVDRDPPAPRIPIHVASIGCSSGAELYSVAMLLAAEGLLDGATLRGLDCRRDAIIAARRGAVTRDDATSIPEIFRACFEDCLEDPVSDGRSSAGRVATWLRERCRWQVADAFALPADVQRAHVILCRNLAIYLRPEAAAELWSDLAGRLRGGGLLVVGRADRPTGPASALLTRIAPCIYRRRRSPLGEGGGATTRSLSGRR